jgi:trehalose-phosphatase
LAGRLQTDLRRVPGVVVENKSLTLSVHYRRVPRAHLPGLQRMLRRLRIQGATLPLQWKKGHEVWEILPRVAWNKGAAALYLIRRLRFPFAVALGDDRTDEDLFAAVKGKGVSIRVGRKRASRADYYLGGQWQVSRFLALAKRVLSSTT